MKKIYLLLCFAFFSTISFGQTLYDSFTDGDFTVNPVWGGNTTAWTVVANSDVAAGATGSQTVRLAAPAVSQTDYLNSQIATWGVSQEWGFFLGRRAQAYTAANQAYFWLYANESTLTSATVDGYRIAIGDDVGVDNFRLEYIVNGAVSATVINVTNGFTNGLTDIGILVRVTRSAAGAWEIFTSTIATANGTGAIATDIPNAANASISQGTGTDNSLVPAANGYVGVAALHSTGANAIAAVEVDQVYFTPTLAGTPNINVTPASLTGFISTSGVPTAPQTYTVDGSNLTNDISIVPPTGYEISTTNAPFTPTNPITLTQTGGNVPTTTIYVRMNSVTLGVNAGNITHSSTGSNNPNVSVTGKVIAAEPTAQGVITINTTTNSTINLNISAGDGAKQILAVRAGAAVTNDPADGTTYTASTTFGLGSNLGNSTYVVYNGVSGNGGAPITVSGLTIGTTYHFALYEYNDGGVANAENYLVPPATANATTLTGANIYVWGGAADNTWTNALNWVPSRLFPATNDSLLFTGPLTVTVTNVPTQTIGYLETTLGSNVTLQPSAASNVLTIGGSTSYDLFVEAGSALNISGANALTISLPAAATALIDGDMTFTGGAHKLTAADANGVTFNGTFTAGAGFSSNAFGGGTTNSVVFATGSVYNHIAGANPFNTVGGVAQFQTGSLYRMLSNLALSLSGRTYADIEIDNAAFSQSGTGAGALSINNLTITQGILMGINTTGGVSIKGNVTIPAGATLAFSPASLTTLTFNGTAAQTISNSGTLTYGALESLTINNAAGVNLNSSITLGPTTTLTLTSGILKLNGTSTTVTLSSGTALAGTPSNTTFIDGKVKKIGMTGFVFPIGKTGFGYVPLEISTFVGGTVNDEFTAEYVRGNARLLGPITAGPGLDHVSGCDYWTLDKGIATPTSVDVKLYWSANNICNGTYIDDLPSLTMAHFDGAGWNSFPVSPILTGGSTTAVGSITWPTVTAFSPFSLAGATFGLNPLPIVVNYFNGTKQNGNHLLNWKVTCNSTPGVTMELLRSTDGRNFSGINTINATALQCLQPFNYTDVNPLPGVNYYRLKMTDADGKVTYSSIVTLLNAAVGIEIMTIAPNPIQNRNFKLNISAAQKTQIDIVITDMQGRLLQTQTVNAIAGFNTVPVNVTRLATGTYQVYAVTGEGRSKVLRFVIQ